MLSCKIWVFFTGWSGHDTTGWISLVNPWGSLFGISQSSTSSRRTAKTLTRHHPMSILKQNSYGGKFRIFLYVTEIMGHFLVRKNNQLVSSNGMSWCTDIFFFSLWMKIMDKQQHHCFNLLFIEWWCLQRTREELFIPWCLYLRLMTYWQESSFSPCYLIRKTNGISISSERNSYFRASSLYPKILSQKHLLPIWLLSEQRPAWTRTPNFSKSKKHWSNTRETGFSSDLLVLVVFQKGKGETFMGFCVFSFSINSFINLMIALLPVSVLE